MDEFIEADAPRLSGPRHEHVAAVLANCGDDSALCGLTAAAVHGFWLPALPFAIHVATAEPARVARDMLRTRLPGVRGHRRELDASDIQLVAGLAVTTPQRTWVDLAGVLAVPGLVAAGDSMLRGGTTRDQVDDVIRRSAGHRGIRRARASFELLDERSRSRPESHLRVATIAPDLPRFDVNVAIYRAEGGWLAEPDLSLEGAKIALEYQGADHARLRRMRRDITRGGDMRRNGWLTLPYGPAEVFVRPWQIVPELRSLIRERRPGLLLDIRRPRLRRVVA